MIKVYFSKLENGNLEITEKMLNDILSHIKRQENEIKRLKESEEYHRKGFTELHKRIEEAIEYLEAVNKSNQKMFVLVDKQYLLDILKGDDNNE